MTKADLPYLLLMLLCLVIAVALAVAEGFAIRRLRRARAGIHMSNDATPIRLTKIGKVTIDTHERLPVVIEGFEGENCSCRDVAILACMWAIGVLQRETTKTIEVPGGGGIGIGD